MATYRQRASGWRVEVCVNKVRDSATFDTKQQAKAWAAQRETELRHDHSGFLESKRTLKDALIRYRDEVSVTKKGCKWETNRINAFLRNYPKLAAKQLTRVTTDDLVAWRNDRLKQIQGGSFRRDATLISCTFNVARLEWKWVKENPMSDLKLPMAPPHRDRRVTQDEIDRLLLAMGHTDAQPRNFTQQVAIAFLLALETAMRAGEIRGLTWDRVNLDGRYVRLLETKNGTKRDVPLSKRAVVLLQQMQGIDAHRVFTVSNTSFDALFRKCRDRCQIENLHFHDTRHEACTRLAQKLPSTLDLARMIGHKDPRSLMIYYNATATEIALRLD